ncbi:MAG: hypothetical protein ACRD04_03740, partial [Terriglobales bacterium]
MTTSTRCLAHRFLPLLLASSLFAMCAATAAAQQTPAHSQYPSLPTEISAHFQVPTPKRPYSVRIVEISMRDGTKLNTVILIPKGAHDAGIVLDRTP